MLSEEDLKRVLSKPGLPRRDTVLLCLAFDVRRPKTVKEIKRIGKEAGLPEMAKWNISDVLRRAKGLAIRTPEGWELTLDGKSHVMSIAGNILAKPPREIAASLREILPRISNPQIKSFVEETITCYEMRLYRAAIVLSWVGAISLLQEYVVQNHLARFNTEARRRNPKWKFANTREDLTQMREYDFLQIANAISVISKSVRQELEICLKRRNACAHPSDLKLADNVVAAHLEVLILNVFQRFNI